MRQASVFRVVSLALALWSASAPAPALAQPTGEAEVLFEQGRALKEAGKCDQAIDKFIASQRLGPAVGTQLNIADCSAQLGRTASAWTHFMAASNAARSAGDRNRADFARKRADALAPRLSRLVITVSAPKPGQIVRRGDIELSAQLWGTAVPVDPGVHVITAEAPGHEPWSGKIEVRVPGNTASLDVPELEALPVVEVDVTDEPDEIDDDGQPVITARPRGDQGLHPQAIGGIAVTAVGSAGLLVALGLAIRSRVLDDASDDYCPTDPNVCLPMGAELREDARDFQQTAIVAAAASAAAVGVGLTVWLTAPDDSTIVSGFVMPWIGRDVGGGTAVLRW